MKRLHRNWKAGFSLLELLIALAVGLVVVGAGITLFRNGMEASVVVSQRAQMQEDLRAAENLMLKDISLAGAGLPVGGIATPTGPRTFSAKIGCDQTACYLPAAAPVGIPLPNDHLYWLIPGAGKGPTINAASGPTDVVTVVYADTALPLGAYNITLNGPSATDVTFTLPNPAPAPLPTPVNDASVGLTTGDLVLFQNTQGQAIGELTQNVTANGNIYDAKFNDKDVLLFNQVAATGGDLQQLLGGAQTTATRVFVISYFLAVLPDPSGAGPGTPRLMRQVNGQTPAPVAENVVDLRFVYDAYDNNGNLVAALPDGGASLAPPISPNLIQKVGLHLIARSSTRGLKGYQNIDLQTEVSVRNMSFKDRYQ
ncbi:MAG TPA: prepilin-type N-terminal cleavage/methylation domain-containing protein [Candidatus Saccharimonadales bacterium]|jgi:prepilin-type N-terminal cleavage/methylation domain-containing protein|nr:prepilin-type N-terminal cleavage/methylation domain-containing protein [Candidatus Saccharimonadales bacterium]